jgi:hypothetical protein
MTPDQIRAIALERAISTAHIRDAAFTTLSVLAMSLAEQVKQGDESKRGILAITIEAMEAKLWFRSQIPRPAK